MSTFPINPLPSFDDPVAILHACHDRIEAHGATLEKLVEYLSHSVKAKKGRHDVALKSIP